MSLISSFELADMVPTKFEMTGAGSTSSTTSLLTNMLQLGLRVFFEKHNSL